MVAPPCRQPAVDRADLANESFLPLRAYFLVKMLGARHAGFARPTFAVARDAVTECQVRPISAETICVQIGMNDNSFTDADNSFEFNSDGRGDHISSGKISMNPSRQSV